MHTFYLLSLSLSPQLIDWVCPLTAQGFLPSFIISGCVCQPSFCFGFVSAIRPTLFVLWGLSPLSAPLSLHDMSANHPITSPGCIATPHSRCSPREHPVATVSFTARLVLILFMQLESELLLNSFSFSSQYR